MNVVKSLLTILVFGLCPIFLRAEGTPSEKTVALDFLKSRGIAKNALSITEEANMENCVVYGSNYCFVIIAKNKLHGSLRNPILAYSNESPYLKDNNTIRNLLDYYDSQLSLIATDSLKEYSYPEGFDFNKRSPILLGNINQNQAYLTRKIENHKAFSVWSGCVACAMSQLIEYHRFPISIQDTVSFHDNNNKANYERVLEDMPGFPSKGTMNSGAAEKLQILCSYAAHISFGEAGSSGNQRRMRLGLIHHFGYSPTMKIWGLDSTSISVLYDELDHKRPCEVSGFGHAFICDGYHGEFLHLNMGWGKRGNGYYRLAVNSQKHFPIGLLTGIEPDTLGEKRLEFIVEKPGDLYRRWTESKDELSDVSSLALRGSLNNGDLYALRCMSSGQGRLSSLDLSKALFYVQSPKSKFDSYILPVEAFINCNGLREVQLPDSLVMIGHDAFSGCSGLREIHLPPTVRYVDIRSFAYTERLRHFYYNKDYTRFLVGKDNSSGNDAVFYKSCPTLKIIGY